MEWRKTNIFFQFALKVLENKHLLCEYIIPDLHACFQILGDLVGTEIFLQLCNLCVETMVSVWHTHLHDLLTHGGVVRSVVDNCLKHQKCIDKIFALIREQFKAIAELYYRQVYYYEIKVAQEEALPVDLQAL